MLASTTHALLDALREQGLRLGLVSNAIDPPWLLHRDLEQLGVADRLDVALFSSEEGWRKPHPAMFERALAELGVEADRALFVGDSLANDVGGAAALGMRTCQAVWFAADDAADGPGAGLPGVHADGRPDRRPAAVVSGDSVLTTGKHPVCQDLRRPESRTHNECR